MGGKMTVCVCGMDGGVVLPREALIWCHLSQGPEPRE